MRTSLLSTKIKVTEAIATTIAASPSSGVVGKLFARVVLVRLRFLPKKCTQSYSAVSEPRGRPLKWFFLLRQLQEKCREQRKALSIAFIDLTMDFNLVRRDELFKILAKIGCPPTLLTMIQSFHEDMNGTVVHDG
ncbi:uncharacterized protein [Procambarus clarkii]|uniref:uncharacterized protein n=1 Tax=Procambarus clarkii TaxID=6728 RepID=UPI0037442B42